jgi:hypothetical protein
MDKDETMDSYYVTWRSVGNDYRRTERYSADNFAHAEEQALNDQWKEGDEVIIQIERDYK